MCDEGTGEDAIWYGPKVTCARRDSAMVCRSLEVYSGERFRLEEERVPMWVISIKSKFRVWNSRTVWRAG